MKSEFISGLDLAQAFFEEVVRPLIKSELPDLPYAAALIGSGSEVLGFDTVMSTDHDWGPRVMIFLAEDQYEAKSAQLQLTLARHLPSEFNGYPTGFPTADGQDKHRVEIYSLASFLSSYLGYDRVSETPDYADWLTFPEQKLRALAAGRVFHDHETVGIETLRRRFHYYPHDVWLYMLACAWARIEQEGHLMSRAGNAGDEIGSALIGARLVRDVMRLSFLMAKEYAPYPKWFGTAFKQLPGADTLSPLLQAALAATDWQERERHLTEAYEHLARAHNKLALTATLPEKVFSFHDRPFKVISTGQFSSSLIALIEDKHLRELATKPLIGAIDQISDNTDLLTNSQWRKTLKQLYSPEQS